MALNVLYEYSLKHNQLDLFLEDLDSLYPHLFDKPPTGLDKSAMATYFAGVSFYHNGETERGLELLRYWLNAEDRFEDVYGVSRTSVSVLWLLDDKDRALTNLQRLAPDKYYWELNPLLLKHDSMFDPIREEPQFVALMADFDRNAAEQRMLLQAMNAN
jgi:hypothetical protein